MSEEPSSSKTSSTTTDEEQDDLLNEGENFIESLISQVDREAIEDVISIQKKSLERFEKTNEMLSTCRNLTEKRLFDAQNQFKAGKELINQSKADLEHIFQRLRNLKMLLADRYPEIYTRQVEAVESEFPQESED